MPHNNKRVLHCIMLCILSLFFTGSARALTITNLDEVPHNLTLVVADETRTISLMPHKRWHSSIYPIKVQYDGYQSPALKRRGHYAIWPGGKLSLQQDRQGGRGKH